MRRAWFQVAMLALLCTALVAAPCKNCQPNPQAESQKTHDCCPKPKSQPAKSCLWQPADVSAVADTHKVDVILPVSLAAPLVAESLEFAPHEQPQQPAPIWSSPPLYLAHATLLI